MVITRLQHGADEWRQLAARSGLHWAWQHRLRCFAEQEAADTSWLPSGAVTGRWLDTVLVSLGFRQWILPRSLCWMLWIISAIRWMVILYLPVNSILPALLLRWWLWL